MILSVLYLLNSLASATATSSPEDVNELEGIKEKLEEAGK